MVIIKQSSNFKRAGKDCQFVPVHLDLSIKSISFIPYIIAH